MHSHRDWRLYAVGLAAVLGRAALAQAGPPALPDVVISNSPLPGAEIDSDKVPGLTQSAFADDVALAGAAGLNGALAARLASINLNDNSGSVFQPDVLYRGFAASPVLGTPQGLAVYQSGVRINEAFGDAVNWDLIPDAAIDRIDVVSANPVYGLNALGGGITIRMKDGFRWHGAEVDLSGGSFRERAGTLQVGTAGERFAFYGAARALDRDGWRQASDERIRQLYLSASARGASTRVDLTYTHAGNALSGQGAAPVQELALDRTLVFTGPQGDQDQVDLLTLSTSWQASPTLAAQAVAYDRRYAQRIDNGNRTDYVPCLAEAAPGFLCQSDGQTLLHGPDGAWLADPSTNGAVPLGENDRERIDATGRGIALQLTSSHAIAGRPTIATLGASLDEATVLFASDVEVGPLDDALRVVPTGLYVATPEGTGFAATAVRLRAAHRYVGAYATATVDLTAALSVTASARYNDATLDLRDLAGSALTGASRFTHFNPGVGFTWRLHRGVTAYAGVSRNTRTPTASEIECSDPARPCLLPSSLAGDPPTLRQVVARTVEAGLRGRLATAGGAGWHVLWHAGAYRTELGDDIYGVATGTGTGYFRNIGSTRREGIEAGIEAGNEAWSASVDVARLDATFESALVLPSPSNPAADAMGDIAVRPGNRLPGLPRHRLKVDLTRRAGERSSVGITLAAMGPSYLHGDEANRMAPLPGYAVVGLHGEYGVARQTVLYARMQNVLDARYSTFGLYADPSGLRVPGVPAIGADPRFESPAAPRSVFIGVRVRM